MVLAELLTTCDHLNMCLYGLCQCQALGGVTHATDGRHSFRFPILCVELIPWRDVFAPHVPSIWSPAKHPSLAPRHVDLCTSFDEGHHCGPARVSAHVPVGKFTFNHQGHQLSLPLIAPAPACQELI